MSEADKRKQIVVGVNDGLLDCCRFVVLALAGIFRGPCERSGVDRIGVMSSHRACRYTTTALQYSKTINTTKGLGCTTDESNP